MAATLGELIVNVIARVAPFRQGLQSAQQQAESFQQRMVSMAKSVAASLGAIFSGQQILSFMEKMDAIGKASDRLGIAAESLQELQFAAQLSGVSAEQLTQSLMHARNILTMIQEDIARGKENKLRVLLEEIGLSVDELVKLKPDEMLKRLADAAQAAGNKEITLTIAAQLLGAPELANLLNTGREGIERLAEEVRKLGGVADSETIKRIEQFHDDMTRLKATMVPALLELAGALTILSQVVKEFLSSIEASASFFKGISIQNALRGLEAIGDTLGTVIGEAFGAAMTGQSLDAEQLRRVIEARQRALVERVTPPPAIARAATEQELVQQQVEREAREQQLALERQMAEHARRQAELLEAQITTRQAIFEAMPLLADPTLLRNAMVGERIDTGVALRGSREAFEREAARKQDTMIELMEEEITLLRQMLDELTGGAIELGLP
jgi:hypothetical protein